MAWHFSRHGGLRTRPAHPLLTSIAVIAALILAAAAIIVFLFTDALLNHFAKGKLEQVFAEAYPGYHLRIGTLHYSFASDYTECRGVSLASNDSSIGSNAGSVSVSTIGWRQLISDKALTPEVFRKSVLTAEGIVLWTTRRGYEVHCTGIHISMADSEITVRDALMEFKTTRYKLSCGLLRISARDSVITAEKIALAPLAGDEDFFGARRFRRTRFRLNVAQCRLSGVPVRELLRGEKFRCRAFTVEQPELALLVNRDKFSDPQAPRPLMPGEALAGVRQPLRLDTIALHNGRLVYEERVASEGHPGIITFDAVELAAYGISNSGTATARVQGHGTFMGAGVMSVDMQVALPPHGISISYTGGLTAMDAAALNRFLPIAEHTQIKSGRIHKAAFTVNVAHGSGTGTLDLQYDDLYVTILDEETGKKNVLSKQLTTIIANLVKIHRKNMPDSRGSLTTGKVKYEQDPTDTFMNITWLSLRSAVQDVVGF